MNGECMDTPGARVLQRMEAITHKLMAKKILNTYKNFLTTLHFIVCKSEFIIFISWWEEIK